MTYYILKLVIMLPIMAAMIYGALWLYRKYQPGMLTGVQQKRGLKLVETLPMGTSGKLAIVEFAGQKILLSASRGGIQHIATAEADAETLDAIADDAETGSLGPAAGLPFQNLMQRALEGARNKQA
ncbi:MAG: flagellar biosynthetic protein FliO [Pseudomonadota bacterium]